MGLPFRTAICIIIDRTSGTTICFQSERIKLGTRISLNNNWENNSYPQSGTFDGLLNHALSKGCQQNRTVQFHRWHHPSDQDWNVWEDTHLRNLYYAQKFYAVFMGFWILFDQLRMRICWRIAWLIWSLTKNSSTISFCGCVFWAVYNRAVEDGLTNNRNPFKSVYTGWKTINEPCLQLKAIKGLNLSLITTLTMPVICSCSVSIQVECHSSTWLIWRKDLQNGTLSYQT